MKYLISIKQSETSLFIATFSILTLTIFIHKILRVLKDTLVITDPNIGIQLIPFLKIWAFIPISIIVIKGVYILKNKYSYKTTYGITLAFFILSLSGYVFFIRSIETSLCPSTHYAMHLIPTYLQGFYLMLQYWPLSLFYVFCDLWPIIMFSMLFWMYIDEIISLKQGKRFFPLYSIDIGGILLAPIVALASYLSGGSWEIQLELLMGLVVILGIILWGLFNKLSQEYGVNPHAEQSKPSKNSKSWFKNSMQWRHYPFVIYLALIVFLFEFTDTIFDLLWKGILFEHIPSPGEFSTYLANVSSVSGILATLVALFFSTTLLRKLSWFRVAVIAPILFGLLSLCFFLSYFFPFLTAWLGTPFGMSALGVTVLIGAVQTCLMSTAKVTVFDNSKDLAFQLCNREERSFARGFANAFAMRTGKSASNLTYQIASMTSANIIVALPYLACIMLMSIPAWLIGLSHISRQFVLRTAKEVP